MGIDGTMTSDMCTVICCGPCALAQDAREIKRAKEKGIASGVIRIQPVQMQQPVVAFQGQPVVAFQGQAGPQQGAYPPQQQGTYPPQQQGAYPPQHGAYPQQQQGEYQPQQGGYPPQQGACTQLATQPDDIKIL